MIGSLYRTSISSLLLAALIAAPAGAEPNSRLEKLRAAESVLVKDNAKLRLRHNLDKLAADWRALAVSSSGADRVAALEGEARALQLLAHWSGTAEDKAAAAKANAQLASAKSDDKPKKVAEKITTQRPTEKLVAKAAEKPEAKAPEKPAMLTKVELETREIGVEVLLPKNAGLRARTEILVAKAGKGPRLYFDVSPLVAAREALVTLPIDHPNVSRLRVGQYDPDTVRFVFDLPVGGVVPELLTLIDGDSPRLRLGKNGAWDAQQNVASAADREKTDGLAALLEVQRALDQVAPGEAASVTPRAKEALEAMVADLHDDSDHEHESEAGEVEIEIMPAAPVAPGAAFADSDSASPPGVNKTTRAALAEKKGSLVRVRRVLIDAGHGGKDGGATGKKGTKEKDVNLAIALALAKVLHERLGVEVVLTRTKDVYVSLGRRVEIANKADADLFVSVHSNAHRNKKFQGIETYYLNTTSSRYANRLAARENQEQFDDDTLDAGDPSEPSSEGDAGALPGGAMGRDLRLLLADLAMRSATDDSRRLAGLVQSHLIGQLRKVSSDIADLGVKHALFYVLLGARMPSILVESGFLSHPDEERRLADPAYQRKVAEAIASGVARFVEERNQVASRL